MEARATAALTTPAPTASVPIGSTQRFLSLLCGWWQLRLSRRRRDPLCAHGRRGSALRRSTSVGGSFSPCSRPHARLRSRGRTHPHDGRFPTDYGGASASADYRGAPAADCRGASAADCRGAPASAGGCQAARWWALLRCCVLRCGLAVGSHSRCCPSARPPFPIATTSTVSSASTSASASAAFSGSGSGSDAVTASSACFHVICRLLRISRLLVLGRGGGGASGGCVGCGCNGTPPL